MDAQMPTIRRILVVIPTSTYTQRQLLEGLLAYAHVWNEGDTYPGQWGWDDPNGAGVVPAGYAYVDVRVSNIITWGITGDNGNVTFTGVLPILTTANTDC